MKTIIHVILTLALFIIGAAPNWAQTDSGERAVVKFSDPGKPGLLKVHLIMGSITVTGYDGAEVIIESKIRERKIQDRHDFPHPPPPPRLNSDEQGETEKEKKREAAAQGLKKLSISTSNLSVEEKDNVMEIEINSFMQTVDLTIRAPRNTSLKLSTVNNGTVSAENINGDLEVTNVNGSVKLTGISGTAIANTTNGDVTVVFNRVSAGKPMAFSSFNGDVDITLPADTKANLKLKSDRGDIYSDFDMKLEERSQKKEERSDKERGGRYRLILERSVFGTLNGGGPEFSLGTFTGSIYIRKGK